MEIENAINTAELWQAGKMIGGDEDEVRNTLLDEVKKLKEHQQCLELVHIHQLDIQYMCVGCEEGKEWRAFQNLNAEPARDGDLYEGYGHTVIEAVKNVAAIIEEA